MTLLTRQTFPFPGLQQDGPLSVQVSWLAALTQVGLRNVLPVDAHAVYMLPGTKTKYGRRLFHKLLKSQEEQTTESSTNYSLKKKDQGNNEVSTGWLPALVTTDHVAVVVSETTDAAGDVSAVAAIL